MKTKLKVYRGTDSLARIAKCSTRLVQRVIKSRQLEPDAIFITANGRKLALFANASVAEMSARLGGSKL